MENFFNNKSIFQLLNKWKKHVIITVAASVVIGGFVSSPIVIAPMFKSATVLYPINLPTLSTESKTEQMLQIIQSIDIRKKMIKTFDLCRHYKINPSNRYWFSLVNDEFDGNVSFSKTEFEGVEIVVKDIDPVIASNMIDSLIKFYNEKVEVLHKQKNYEMVQIKGSEMVKKKKEIDSLESKQKEFKLKYGFIDIGSQTKELTRGYLNLVAGGKKGTEAAKEISAQLENFKDKADEYNQTSALLYAAQIQFNAIKDEYEKNLTEVQKKITYCIVVEHPFPADKKSSPIRSLIVLGFVIFSLITSIIGIAFIESRKK